MVVCVCFEGVAGVCGMGIGCEITFRFQRTGSAESEHTSVRITIHQCVIASLITDDQHYIKYDDISSFKDIQGFMMSSVIWCLTMSAGLPGAPFSL